MMAGVVNKSSPSYRAPVMRNNDALWYNRGYESPRNRQRGDRRRQGYIAEAHLQEGPRAQRDQVSNLRERRRKGLSPSQEVWPMSRTARVRITSAIIRPPVANAAGIRASVTNALKSHGSLESLVLGVNPAGGHVLVTGEARLTGLNEVSPRGGRIANPSGIQGSILAALQAHGSVQAPAEVSVTVSE